MDLSREWLRQTDTSGSENCNRLVACSHMSCSAAYHPACQSVELNETHWMARSSFSHERQTAQNILLSSMRKLDEGRKSRAGIQLQRGLMIAFTALKARQILWQQPFMATDFSPVYAPIPEMILPKPELPPISQTFPAESHVDTYTWSNTEPEKSQLCDFSNSFDCSQEPIFPEPLPIIFSDELPVESALSCPSDPTADDVSSLADPVSDTDLAMRALPICEEFGSNFNGQLSVRKRHRSAMDTMLTSYSSTEEPDISSYFPSKRSSFSPSSTFI